MKFSWNEWIPLPIHYCDLPRDAILVFTIYDSIPEYGEKLVIGSTAIPLFDQHGIFRQGIYDLKIEPDIEADDLDKLIIDDFDSSDANKDPANHMFRLSQLTKKHRNGLITKIDWLDRLTFREIEVINEREKRKSNHMYLMVEFPNIFVDNILHSVGESFVNVFDHLENFTIFLYRIFFSQFVLKKSKSKLKNC